MARKMVDEKVQRGGVIRTETAPVREQSMVNDSEALLGRKMGGGPTDVGCSLTGAGEVATYNNTAAKKRSY